nr:hypothetical protein [Tanacetum cinerariifolium]
RGGEGVDGWMVSMMFVLQWRWWSCDGWGDDGRGWRGGVGGVVMDGVMMAEAGEDLSKITKSFYKLIKDVFETGSTEGTACLPNDVIFEGLARMSAKTTAWNKFSSTMASAIICLANNQEFNYSKYILENMTTEVPHTEPQAEERVPTPFHDPLPSGDDRLQLNELTDICTKLSDRVLSLEQTKTNQAVEIEKLKKRVKKLEGKKKKKKKKRTHGLKRLYKEDASKQGRIAEIDANEDLFLIDETAQDQG